jgi:phage terminase large subunit-like protein
MGEKLGSAMMHFLYRYDVVAFARELLGVNPDPAQEKLLRTLHRRVMLNCHRQWGKSLMAAIRAVFQALTRQNQTIVIVSIDARHSQRLANRCRELVRRLEMTVRGDGTNERSILFPNGSVIIPLPGKADAMRGFTANLLIIDEAARVPDEVYTAARPMLAATNGDLWLLSTPRGKRGFFYEEWSGKDSPSHPWLRIEGKPADHDRITKEFLATEVRRNTAEEFGAEYGCEFVTQGRNVFSEEWLERAFRADVPTFDELSRTDLQFVRHRPAYYVSLDLGYSRDHAALVILEYRPIPTGTHDPATYQFLYRRELRLVHLERFRLRTGFPQLLARLDQLCNHPHLAHNTQLLVDVTSQPMLAQMIGRHGCQ